MQCSNMEYHVHTCRGIFKYTRCSCMHVYKVQVNPLYIAQLAHYSHEKERESPAPVLQYVYIPILVDLCHHIDQVSLQCHVTWQNGDWVCARWIQWSLGQWPYHYLIFGPHYINLFIQERVKLVKYEKYKITATSNHVTFLALLWETTQSTGSVGASILSKSC